MHKYIKPVSLSVCPKCRKTILPHTACKNCGYYKGREVINVLSKLTKKEQKTREKEMKKIEKEQKKDSPVSGSLSMEDLSKK
jgi:ribosomal protein L32